jgi:hypothetical protein
MTSSPRLAWDRLTDGTLTCEEHLRVAVTEPIDLGKVLQRLERAHFAEVERASFGVIRCHRQVDGVVCAAAGRWPALAFGSPETTLTATAGRRCWPIRDGLLARPSATLGTLTLAVERQGEGLLLTSAVEGFPSRFLGDPLPGLPRELWRVVGHLYVGYHRHVSFRSLERVARELRGRRPHSRGCLP